MLLISRGFQIRLGLIPAYSKLQLYCAAGLRWSPCSRLGRCLRLLCMITGQGNGLAAQLFTCSHILGGFWTWGPAPPPPVATGGIPERCVPGTRPANTARTHHCRFDSPFRPSAVLPTSQCCCSGDSLKLFTKRSCRLGSGPCECFTTLSSRCCYASEPPVGVEPTTIRLRSACSTN